MSNSWCCLLLLCRSSSMIHHNSWASRTWKPTAKPTGGEMRFSFKTYFLCQRCAWAGVGTLRQIFNCSHSRAFFWRFLQSEFMQMPTNTWLIHQTFSLNRSKKYEALHCHLDSTRFDIFNLFRLCWNNRILRIFVSNRQVHLLFWRVSVTMSLSSSITFARKHFVFFSLDSQFRSINALYTKPYTRVGCYFAGVCTGFYLSRINRQWNVSKVSYLIVTSQNSWIAPAWFLFSSTFAIFLFPFHAVQSTANVGRILSLIIVAFMVFVQRYRVAQNFWVAMLFPALGRTLWSVPVCFMIIAGSTQHHTGKCD